MHLLLKLPPPLIKPFKLTWPSSCFSKQLYLLFHSVQYFGQWVSHLSHRSPQNTSTLLFIYVPSSPSTTYLPYPLERPVSCSDTSCFKTVILLIVDSTQLSISPSVMYWFDPVQFHKWFEAKLRTYNWIMITFIYSIHGIEIRIYK